MDEFVASSDVPAVDQGGGPQSPEPAAASSETAEAEVLAVVPRGKQKKSKQREEKLERMTKQPRKSKPPGASAPSWAYFECYALGRFKEYAVCTLCVQQNEFERSEIKYSQSPSNLLRPLNTDYPGHREAFDACVAKAPGKKPTARARAGGVVVQQEQEDSEEEQEDSEEEDASEEEDENNSSRVYLDPLGWWRMKSADFPHLAILARRVLAIPATQAESERLFSCAGNIVTKNRNKLAPSTVELLVLLRHSWKIVEEREASNAAAKRLARGGSA
ncbi:unnamed protein product [Ectocarpus sp. 12 AP-2014]